MTAALIAFSGTHGTGKSSTIKRLVELYPRSIEEDTFKVSRECQKLLGYEKLSEAYETPERMMRFQEFILSEKRKSDYSYLSSSSPIVLTERSYLDIAAYTNEWINRLIKNYPMNATEQVELFQWYANYKRRCSECMHVYSGLIIVHPLTFTEFEHDPNRADLESRDNIHNFIMDELISGDFMTGTFNLSTVTLQKPIQHLKSDLLENRVIKCKEFIDEIFLTKATDEFTKWSSGDWLREGKNYV